MRWLLVVTAALGGCEEHCLRYERREVRIPAWTQVVVVPTCFNGRCTTTMYPVFHPAYDTLVNVCLERKKRE